MALDAAGSCMVCLDRLAVLRFFDEAPADSRRHASAICAMMGEELGLGLLQHRFERAGASSVTVYPKCTQGTRSGVRLDGWVEVTDGSGAWLYQVEVKNWSAHAIGGSRLSINADADSLREHRRAQFEKCFCSATGSVCHPKLEKVVVPMKPPLPLPVRPLACMWYPLHYDGQEEPFFSVPLADSPTFDRLYFFSMSNYLRSIQDSHVVLHMPSTLVRMSIMGTLMGVSAA